MMSEKSVCKGGDFKAIPLEWLDMWICKYLQCTILVGGRGGMVQLTSYLGIYISSLIYTYHISRERVGFATLYSYNVYLVNLGASFQLAGYCDPVFNLKLHEVNLFQTK